MTTFPAIAIDNKSTYKRTPRNLTNSFGDGYSQIYADGINAYSETWNLSFSNRPKADIDTIQNFLNTQLNGVVFQWQAPDDGSVKNWRLVGDYSITDADNQTRSISFQIERYFGA